MKYQAEVLTTSLGVNCSHDKYSHVLVMDTGFQINTCLEWDSYGKLVITINNKFHVICVEVVQLDT